MRKEVIYALIAGSFLGIIIAFGIWRANWAFKTNGTKAPEGTTPVATPQEVGLTIAKPDDFSVLGQNPVTISGISGPENWIVISSDNKDSIFQTELDGAFEQELTLSGGANRLLLTALDKSGAASSKTLTLVFSSEFSQPEPISTPEGATEESEIREKVIKKVQEALNNPKAYLGTVTDISSLTLQIKTEAGEIKQISTKEDLSGVKFADIAIGDFVVAMGFQNGQEILETTRILITQEPPKISVTPILGTVTGIDKKTVTLKTRGEKEITLNFPKKWQGPEINKIKAGDELIAVGKLTEDAMEIRTVFLIPSPTPSLDKSSS